MDLISQLKEEHQRILFTLKVIQKDLKTVEEGIILDSLANLRTVLVEHLKLEDNLLYPFFEKSKIPELKQLGKSFSGEMKKIGEIIFKFFDDYEGKMVSDLREDKKFMKILVDIKEAVIKRVTIEENILFPAYSQYNKK